MNRTVLTSLAIATLIYSHHIAQAESLSAVPDALVHPDGSVGYSIGANYQIGSRALRLDSGRFTVDIDRVVAHASVLLTSYLNLGIEAGTIRLERRAGDLGDFGPALAVISTLNALKVAPKAWNSSDVTGTLVFGADLSYSHASSDLESGELSYEEMRVEPFLRYTIEWAEAAQWIIADPKAAGLTFRLMHSRLDGEYGTNDFAEGEDFGLGLDANILLQSGWVTQIGFTTFGGSDTLAEFGFAYNF